MSRFVKFCGPLFIDFANSFNPFWHLFTLVRASGVSDLLLRPRSRTRVPKVRGHRPQHMFAVFLPTTFQISVLTRLLHMFETIWGWGSWRRQGRKVAGWRGAGRGGGAGAWGLGGRSGPGRGRGGPPLYGDPPRGDPPRIARDPPRRVRFSVTLSHSRQQPTFVCFT